MPITKAEAKKEIAMRELGRRRLDFFTKYTFPGYDMWAFRENKEDEVIHGQIISALERVEKWETKRLMIFCPPRLWKSELVSKRFPARYLGRNPEKKIVCCSYSSLLASEFGRLTREVVQDGPFSRLFPEFKLKSDKKEWWNWETSKWGGYYSVWVGGSLTGKGFDIGIIDDPVRNRDDAESEVYREKIKWWYRSTFFTRRMDAKSAIIVMCTRWHEDDLAWWLKAEATEEWDIVEIPAIDKDNNVILWEAKGWDRGYWDTTERTVWSYDWNALYQQKPFDDSTGIFSRDMFRYVNAYELKDNDGHWKRELEFYTFKDPAISQKESADYTADITIAVNTRNNDIYVVDAYLARVGADESIDETFSIAIDYRPRKYGIEKVAFQKMLIDEIEKQMRIKNRYFNLEAVTPMGEKVARIKSTLRHRYSTWRIFHVKGARGIELLESQLLKFPNGKHDDGPDALSWAVAIADTYDTSIDDAVSFVDYSDLT